MKPYLEKNIRFEVFEYAGRGNRISEKPLDSIDAIVDDLWYPISKAIDTEEPYVFYGHSMGALVAYLLCQLNQFISEEEWCSRSRRIIRQYPVAKTLTPLLDKVATAVRGTFDGFERKKEYLSPQLVKKRYLGLEEDVSTLKRGHQVP